MTRITLLDPSLVVLIGPAGAGKSTLAARLFAADEILSSDAYRAMISGDEADQRVTGAAFRALGKTLDRRLGAGLLTVVDATNLKTADRRPWLAAARRHGIRAVALVLDLPPEVVHARNRGRIRVVADDVVDRHLDRLSTAGLEERLALEGFDTIVVLTDPAAVDALEVARVRANAAG